MGLLDKLTTGTGSPLSKANGATPPTPIGATQQSKLQDTYSINGTPVSNGVNQQATNPIS